MIQQLEFEFGCPQMEAEYHREGAQEVLRKLLPQTLLEAEPHQIAWQRAEFDNLLPQVCWSALDKAPCSLSVLLLCQYRLNACHFFYEMISRWLLPGRKMNVELFFASDVRLPHLTEKLLSLAEVVIYLKSAQEVEEVRRHLKTIETEIKLGVASHYHARRILEFKGLSTEGKTAMIQEKIGSLIQSHSKEFDQGIFSQMQQFLVNCPERFKQQRDYHHISRIISNLYKAKKVLEQNIEMSPSKRHVIVKLLKTQLKEEGTKERAVLGVLVGLNFLREHELFEEEHLKAALLQQMSAARFVEGSYLVDPAREGGLRMVYIELESGDDSSATDLQTLKQTLPERVLEHIEQLTHPIFMPRNEEEVLHNLAALAEQFRFVHDAPQVNISFDERRGEELCFTVLLVRARGIGAASIQELLARANAPFPYLPDRVRSLGPLRRKYIKEATLFRTALPVDQFRRPDRSVDLYKARQHLFAELTRALGELRDYNGGMILRQSEELAALRSALGKTAHTHSLLLEQFFHALMPMEARTSAEIEPLKQLFLLLVSASKRSLSLPFLGSDFLFRQEEKRLFAILPRLDGAKRAALLERLERLPLAPHQKIHFSLELRDLPYVGVLLLDAERAVQTQFLAALD